MQTSNEPSVQNLNFVWNIAGFQCQAGMRISRFTDLHINLSQSVKQRSFHSSNITFLLSYQSPQIKLETIYVFEFQRLD